MIINVRVYKYFRKEPQITQNSQMFSIKVKVLVAVVLHYPVFILVCYYTEQEWSEVIF